MKTTPTPAKPATSTDRPRFEIVDNIPLHKVRTRTPATPYPLDKMKVGQSFHVTYGSNKAVAMERIRVQARRLRPKRFALRSEGVNGLRVWRVK